MEGMLVFLLHHQPFPRLEFSNFFLSSTANKHMDELLVDIFPKDNKLMHRNLL